MARKKGTENGFRLLLSGADEMKWLAGSAMCRCVCLLQRWHP